MILIYRNRQWICSGHKKNTILEKHTEFGLNALSITTNILEYEPIPVHLEEVQKAATRLDSVLSIPEDMTENLLTSITCLGHRIQS